MTDADKITALEAEVAQLRQTIADQASALAAHAERERAERVRKDARRRVNRQNYERRKAKDASQTSDSDQIQTLNLPSPPLNGSPLSPEPSLPSPLSSPHPTFPTASAIGGESENLPDATDDAVPVTEENKREALVLVAQSAGKKEPKPSPAQRLYAALEASRKARCEEAGLAFIEQRWDARRINATLSADAKVPKGQPLGPDGQPVPTEAQKRFEAAWGEYLADEEGAMKEPPWSIGWFMSGGVRARYETRAVKAGAA